MPYKRLGNYSINFTIAFSGMTHRFAPNMAPKMSIIIECLGIVFCCKGQ